MCCRILEKSSNIVKLWRKWRKPCTFYYHLNGHFWNQKCSQCWGNRKKDLKHLLSFDLDLFSSRSIALCELIDVGDEISGTKTSREGRIYWFGVENYKGSTHVVNVFTNFSGWWCNKQFAKEVSWKWRRGIYSFK